MHILSSYIHFQKCVRAKTGIIMYNFKNILKRWISINQCFYVCSHRGDIRQQQKEKKKGKKKKKNLVSATDVIRSSFLCDPSLHTAAVFKRYVRRLSGHQVLQ